MPLAGISSVDPNTGIATYGSNTVFPRFYADKKLNTAKVDKTKPWQKMHRDDIPPGAFWEICHMVQVNVPGEIDAYAYEATEFYQRRWPKNGRRTRTVWISPLRVRRSTSSSPEARMSSRNWRASASIPQSSSPPSRTPAST